MRDLERRGGVSRSNPEARLEPLTVSLRSAGTAYGPAPHFCFSAPKRETPCGMEASRLMQRLRWTLATAVVAVVAMLAAGQTASGMRPHAASPHRRRSLNSSGRLKNPVRLDRVLETVSDATERAGFEPATRLSTRTRFPVALLRPLGHLSGRGTGYRAFALYQERAKARTTITAATAVPRTAPRKIASVK